MARDVTYLTMLFSVDGLGSKRQHGDVGRAIDPHRDVHRADAAADEQRRVLSSGVARQHRELAAGDRADAGTITWPPCVWPESTSCTSSAAASVRRRGSCASRIGRAAGAFQHTGDLARRSRPEPDAGDVQPLAIDRQRRALILQHVKPRAASAAGTSRSSS